MFLALILISGCVPSGGLTVPTSVVGAAEIVEIQLVPGHTAGRHGDPALQLGKAAVRIIASLGIGGLKLRLDRIERLDIAFIELKMARERAVRNALEPSE